MRSLPLDREVDVLVIGAGQAGLAMGYHLKATGQRFLIVDRYPRLGESWRSRYDSLVLFTPRAYSALPGLALQGDPDGYPTKDEVADYLEAYGASFDLPVALDTGIRTLTRIMRGFRARTDAGELVDARSVVIATGAFQVPAVPPFAQRFSADVVQLTAMSYQHPDQVPAGSVLVVGDGATGRHIGLELASSGRHNVVLATGRTRRVSPERLLGHSIFWWMDRLGLLRAARDTTVGRYLMTADAFPGKRLGLRRLRGSGVRVTGRFASAEGRTVTFTNGEAVEVAGVVWATGFRDDSRWVAIPEAKDAHGAFVQQRGASPVPGLFYVGRSWQWTRGSALLTGVGADARYVLQRIVEHLGDQGSEAKLAANEMARPEALRADRGLAD